MKTKLTYLLLIFHFFFLKAEDENQLVTDTSTLSEEKIFEIYNQYLDSIERTFSYQYGTIDLKDNIATLNIPKGFKYLNPDDSERLLTEIWGNPPGDPSMGMLMLDNTSPMDPNSFVIDITYSEEGFIKDEDAKDIDYDELLETMQESTREANPSRIEQGYGSIELVGWAATPYYDHENKKLHWAKEIKFDDSETNTLNYNIRILGRKGFLQLNAIGDLSVLNTVNDNISPILESVNFNIGHKYSDFNPDIDEVAAYGIGGLIAGKVLLKAGILAKVGLLLAKFWKVLALGIIGLFAGLKRFFGKGKEDQA